MLIIAFFLPLIIYLKTIGPVFSVFNSNLSGTLDNVEFVYMIQRLGIAHPTGYPLYIMLGKLFTFIPLKDIGFRVNLMSAFFGAATSAVLYLILKDMLKRAAASSIAALTLAFSAVFWSQSLIPEVFTLQTFLMSLFFLFIFKWQAAGEKRALYLSALVLGLGFSNHMTTIILVPSFLYAISFGSRRGGEPRRLFLKELGLVFAAILLGIVPYLYIPIRLSDPDVFIHSMDQVEGIRTGSLRWYKWLLTAEGFREKMFTFEIGRVAERAVFLLSELIRNFTLAGVSLISIGACWGFFYKRKAALALAAAFLGYALFFINYKVIDQDLFFVFIHVIAAIFLGLGIFAIGSALNKKLAVVSLVFIALPASLLFQNYNLNDQSRDHFSDEFVATVLRAVKPRAEIFTHGAFGIGIIYYQSLRNIRGDVTIRIVEGKGAYWKEAIANAVNSKKTPVYFFPAGQMPWWVYGNYDLAPVNLGLQHLNIDQDFIAEALPRSKASIFKERVKPDPSKIRGHLLENGVEILGYTIAPGPEEILIDKVFRISFFLRKSSGTVSSIDALELGFLDDEGRFMRDEIRSFSGVYFLPADDISNWKAGDIMEVKYDLILPVYAPPGEYNLIVKSKNNPAGILLGRVRVRK